MVSAIKVDGNRLYDLARQGLEVERDARVVEIHSIDLLDFAPGKYPEADIEVVCGSGTYIRTLADDLARSLAGRAHLTALRRTAIGPHAVEDAVTIETLAAVEDPAGSVIPMADGLVDLPSIEADGDMARAVGNGVVFASSAMDLGTPGTYRVLDQAGRLLATYVSDGRKAKPEVVVA